MKKKNHLKIFHFDMNFVSLQEAYTRKWLKKLSEMGYNLKIKKLKYEHLNKAT